MVKKINYNLYLIAVQRDTVIPYGGKAIVIKPYFKTLTSCVVISIGLLLSSNFYT